MPNKIVSYRAGEMQDIWRICMEYKILQSIIMFPMAFLKVILFSRNGFAYNTILEKASKTIGSGVSVHNLS